MPNDYPYKTGSRDKRPEMVASFVKKDEDIV